MRVYISFAIILLSLASCTIITTTDIPGKQTSKFPKKMLGNYELIYPTELEAYMTDADKITVRIKQKQLTTIDKNGENTLVLGDSVFFSKVGKDLYLSLQTAKNYNVFKLVYKGKNIELYTMSPQSGTEGLEQYCEKVENVDLDGNGEIDEEESLGMFLNVKIKDSELAKYFKSDIPIKAPFLLKRM